MAMAVAPTSDTTSDDRAAADESQGVPGICFFIGPTVGRMQTIKVLYLMPQLCEHLYPAFATAFRVHGFDAVPWKDLLKKLTVGGEVDLKGKKFYNRKTYSPHTMEKVFMRRERDLVLELMTIVFNNRFSLAYARELTPFKQVSASLQFNTSIALRKTVLLFRADDGPMEDLYRVIIEGEGAGDNLRIHRFKFQPSNCWLQARYPQDVK
jgi:hypothetical protein